MQVPRHAIFREKALKHYAQGKKKDILPNFGSIPAAVFFWGLIVSLAATIGLAIYGQIPLTVSGVGLVLVESAQVQSAGQATALAFFQPSVAGQLRVGQTVTVQMEADSTQATGTVLKVEPGTSDPATALARFGMHSSTASLGTTPVATALIGLGTHFPEALYAGSGLAVEVNAGTESFLAALVGSGNITGE
jgi:hypothetical protein